MSLTPAPRSCSPFSFLPRHCSRGTTGKPTPTPNLCERPWKDQHLGPGPSQELCRSPPMPPTPVRERAALPLRSRTQTLLLQCVHHRLEDWRQGRGGSEGDTLGTGGSQREGAQGAKHQPATAKRILGYCRGREAPSPSAATIQLSVSHPSQSLDWQRPQVLP